MQKLERLLNLCAALLDTPRPLTVEEIHERIPGYPDSPASFRRAFERDKDDLREMGVPLQLVQLGADANAVGYRIPPEDYYLPDPGLDPDELAAVQLALAAVKLGSVSHSDELDVLRKLGGGEIPGEEVITTVPSPPGLAEMFDAVLERRTVRFRYGDEERTVDPWRLDFQRGRWYLTGHDHLRQAERRFRLDRLEGEVSTGAPGAFERPAHVAGAELTPWKLGEGDAVTAVVRVDADRVELARRQIGAEARWREHPDGSATVEVEVTNPDAFRSYVLTLLDHAAVEGPPSLRENLTAWLAPMAGEGP